MLTEQQLRRAWIAQRENTIRHHAKFATHVPLVSSATKKQQHFASSAHRASTLT
jgi:hypothetical protein